MSKWHIADECNHNRPACLPHGKADLTVPLKEWVQRIESDKCQKCAKRRAGAINRMVAYNAANARHPLPISDR